MSQDRSRLISAVRSDLAGNQPLIYGIAQLKHHRFAKVASRSALAPKPAPSPARQPPKRTALAPEFSRTLIQMPMYLQCSFILRRFV